MRLVFVVPSVAFTYDKKLLRKVLRQAGNEIKATARSLIGRSASGRKYGAHIASAPGQPPGSVTGALASSLKVSVKGDRVRVTDTALAAKFLETGAVGGGGKGSASIGRSHKRGGSKGKPQTKRIMQPRPFLSVAADEEAPRLEQQIEQALKAGIDLKVLKSKSV